MRQGPNCQSDQQDTERDPSRINRQQPSARSELRHFDCDAAARRVVPRTPRRSVTFDSALDGRHPMFSPHPDDLANLRPSRRRSLSVNGTDYLDFTNFNLPKSPVSMITNPISTITCAPFSYTSQKEINREPPQSAEAEMSVDDIMRALYPDCQPVSEIVFISTSELQSNPACREFPNSERFTQSNSFIGTQSSKASTGENVSDSKIQNAGLSNTPISLLGINTLINRSEPNRFLVDFLEQKAGKEFIQNPAISNVLEIGTDKSERQKREELFSSLRRVLNNLRDDINFKDFRSKVTNQIAPNYDTIIKEPMALQSMAKKLQNGQYPTKASFFSDIKKIHDNCMKFNSHPESHYRVTAAQFLRRSKKLLESVREVSPPASRSSLIPHEDKNAEMRLPVTNRSYFQPSVTKSTNTNTANMPFKSYFPSEHSKLTIVGVPHDAASKSMDFPKVKNTHTVKSDFPLKLTITPTQTLSTQPMLRWNILSQLPEISLNSRSYSTIGPDFSIADNVENELLNGPRVKEKNSSYIPRIYCTAVANMQHWCNMRILLQKISEAKAALEDIRKEAEATSFMINEEKSSDSARVALSQPQVSLINASKVDNTEATVLSIGSSAASFKKITQRLSETCRSPHSLPESYSTAKKRQLQIEYPFHPGYLSPGFQYEEISARGHLENVVVLLLSHLGIQSAPKHAVNIISDIFIQAIESIVASMNNAAVFQKLEMMQEGGDLMDAKITKSTYSRSAWAASIIDVISKAVGIPVSDQGEVDEVESARHFTSCPVLSRPVGLYELELAFADLSIESKILADHLFTGFFVSERRLRDTTKRMYRKLARLLDSVNKEKVTTLTKSHELVIGSSASLTYGHDFGVHSSSDAKFESFPKSSKSAIDVDGLTTEKNHPRAYFGVSMDHSSPNIGENEQDVIPIPGEVAENPQLQEHKDAASLKTDYMHPSQEITQILNQPSPFPPLVRGSPVIGLMRKFLDSKWNGDGTIRLVDGISYLCDDVQSGTRIKRARNFENDAQFFKPNVSSSGFGAISTEECSNNLRSKFSRITPPIMSQPPNTSFETAVTPLSPATFAQSCLQQDYSPLSSGNGKQVDSSELYVNAEPFQMADVNHSTAVKNEVNDALDDFEYRDLDEMSVNDNQQSAVESIGSPPFNNSDIVSDALPRQGTPCKEVAP